MSEYRKRSQKYTYKDVLAMPEDFRCELIHGEIYAMPPSPTDQHQRVSVRLTKSLSDYFEGKAYELFAAPFDVRFSPKEDDSDDCVVQPDLMAICDASKITRKGCFGAPDLVIEIITPSTAARDYHEKRMLYEANGVKEYWIVVPEGSEHILVLSLSEGKYIEIGMYAEGFAESALFPGLKIDLSKIFARP